MMGGPPPMGMPPPDGMMSPYFRAMNPYGSQRPPPPAYGPPPSQLMYPNPSDLRNMNPRNMRMPTNFPMRPRYGGPYMDSPTGNPGYPQVC